jgi:hypothetical protein
VVLKGTQKLFASGKNAAVGEILVETHASEVVVADIRISNVMAGRKRLPFWIW